jgi:tRNA threonylcarbamoyl adenosine modification protein YjeE
MQLTARSIAELRIFASEFLNDISAKDSAATIVGLSGDLGSGKTAFVKEVAKELGVTDEVLSPTFVLAKFYDLAEQRWKKLVHIDLYRIDDADEIKVLRFEDIASDRKNLVFIEWPKRVSGILPPDSPVLEFTFIDEHSRTISGIF